MPAIRLSRDGPRERNRLLANFPYDPVAIDIIRSVPGREWNATRKVWLIPGTPENIAQLNADLHRVGWHLLMQDDLAEDIRNATSRAKLALLARDRGDSAIAFDYLTTPYAHQRAGLEFLTHLGGGALLWEMGLGKTKTAIDYAEWLCRADSRANEIRAFLAAAYRKAATPPAGEVRVLVICPNTIKRNWGDEIVKHAGHDEFVVPDGLMAKRIAATGSARYTIINCEMLSIEAYVKAITAMTWDLVIVDESTRFKNPKAKRTKALHKLKAAHRVILTGTPVTGAPEDVWAPFEFMTPGLFGSFWAFSDRYLERDFFRAVIGIKPGMDVEIKERIGSRSYRVLKREVLDLPPKVYIDRRVKLSGVQQRAYAQMKDDLRVSIAGTPQLTAFNILTMLLRLTQITAGLIGSSDTGYQWLTGEDNAKLTELDALMEELRGEQVVIFGTYQKELEALAARYVGGGPYSPIIYGPTPEKLRHELIAEFQRGDRRLLFAQTHTGGIGINLTAAQTCVYYTRSWSLEDYLQSQDRLHRIGQTGTVSIVHLVAEGTIDQDIAAALAEKQELADHLTGDRARMLAAQIIGK